MYSHLSCNDKTGGVDFADVSGWFRAATIEPVTGSYASYGKDGTSPWVQLETDAGSFRLIGVAWALHSGSRPPDAATTFYFAVSGNAYIAVTAADSITSIYAFQHESSFDNVYGNGTRPEVADVLGKHPIDLLSPLAKERVDGTDFGDVIILNDQGSLAYANRGKDTVTGGDGDDRLYGANGNDTLSGVGGQDRLFGGNGKDTLSGQDDNDDLHGEAGDDAVYGGDGQDSVYGYAGKDRLFGDEDNDHLYGGDDNDKLSGGIGQDKIYGEAGADALDGDDDDDALYGGGGKDKLHGGLGQDQLFGDGGADTLFGDADNDLFYGAGGNDRLHGGIGQDALNGDAGKDALYGDADNDILNGRSASDKLFGGVGQDKLNGGDGKDKLKGDDDNDRLDGGAGNDKLFGDAGANQFVFTTALGRANIDTIGDFKVGFDSIELSRPVFEALGAGALPEAEFHRGHLAKDADQHILYDPRSGVLIYDANGNGKGGASVFAKLDDHLKISHTDFLII